MKKYLVVPGTVNPKDGSTPYFMEADSIMHKYWVDPQMCVIYEEGAELMMYSELTILTPRDDGVYVLP